MESIEEGGSLEVTVTATAAGATRFYMASNHLWTARHAAQLCAERESQIANTDSQDMEHRSFVCTAVFFAVAFLEGLVNEVLGDAADPILGQENSHGAGITGNAESILNELWLGPAKLEERLQPLVKYQLALACAGKARLETGDDPYQSALILLKLRNALVHFKPDWQADDEPPLEKQLKGRFAENPQQIGQWYPYRALSAGCAEWACTTATNLADEWSQRLGLSWDYRAQFADWRAPETLRVPRPAP
jgi:hypothetical protein